MAAHNDALKELFASYEPELASALDGNIEKYCYKEETDEDNGLHDANCINRLRLACTILYSKEYEEHNRIGGLILRLFNEELTDRETSDSRGIGRCLKTLAFLMNEYELPGRKELFERAENANFDCQAGFSPSDIYIPLTLDDYNFNDAVELLIELHENSTALKLLNDMPESDDVIDEAQMRFCKNCFHSLGDIDNEIKAARRLMNMTVLSGDNFDVCNAMINLIELYNKNKDYHEAGKIFDMLIPRLHSIDDWHTIGLGRRACEQCMDIILNDDVLAGDLWEWSEPFLKKNIDNLHGNLYKKASLAAYKMGESGFSELLSGKYDELMLTTRSIV